MRRLFVLCDDKDALDFFFGLLSGIVAEMLLWLLELLPLLCFRFRMVVSETNAVGVDFAVAVDRIRDFCVLRFDDPLLLLLLVLVLEEPRTTTAVLFGLRFSRPLLRPKAVGVVAVEP